ncbi:MAG: hypothetical protein IJT46_00695 [Bacteroidaceae bacterium]|nr:hypothetical protein [Bacteroidaceae bacterium]
MIELSLSAINACSPYKLRLSALGGFDFDTDSGLTYNIALIQDYTFGESFQTYMLNVLPHSMQEFYALREYRMSINVDKKIEPTVIAVLNEALNNQNIVIDYVCLSDDNRQSSRFRLFNRWFQKNANDNIVLLSTSIEVDGIINYLGAFLRRDNPQFNEFCDAFSKFEEDIHKDW